jgi:hypothetical protein
VAIVRFNATCWGMRIGKGRSRTWVLCCTLVITMGLMASSRSSCIVYVTAAFFV